MIPRAEHPYPQAERAQWLNLNGEWEFEIDSAKNGLEKRFYDRAHLDGHITVPFCPESPLSGVGNPDFLNCVWYRRDLVIPSDWQDGRILLHFGAVDQIARVYINGKLAGSHVGGYASFALDITDLLTDGVSSLCVCAEDDTRCQLYGHGKQSDRYDSYGCFYTRVTGIWQTVWLEHLPDAHLVSFRLTPDVSNQALHISARTSGRGTLTAEAFFEGRSVGIASFLVSPSGDVNGTLPLSELHLWEAGNGRLYDLTLRFENDTVSSYFGMRELAFDGYRFLLNGKSVYQRLVLDQGYYPDGIYTAPSEEALIRDIQISLDAGFNGARLHQKVFEPRFLYHCDRMGYLVWGEFGSWGLDQLDPNTALPLLSEWEEILERDYNHPSIVGWCPLNETWRPINRTYYKDLLTRIYRVTKRLDPTRPCIDTSGGVHIESDIFDTHDYMQDPIRFSENYTDLTPEKIIALHKTRSPEQYTHPACVYHVGQPFFVSEYGGIKWDVDQTETNAWGYGNAPTTEQEFLDRYKGLTDTLLDNPYMFGFCYTQLYDVEQEVNGLYTYDRRPKFDMTYFHTVNTRQAAIETD